MGVLVLAMIEPQIQRCALHRRSHQEMTVTASGSVRFPGLGDQLVGGQASPEQMYRLEKESLTLHGTQRAGISHPQLPSFSWNSPRHALRMEERYGRPLDIEWAVDLSGEAVYPPGAALAGSSR